MQFARDPDGQIHAARHARGDGYICCHCDTPVVLRIGAVREPHFAHLSGTADCPGRRHTNNGPGDVSRPYVNVDQLDFTDLGLTLPEPLDPLPAFVAAAPTPASSPSTPTAPATAQRPPATVPTHTAPPAVPQLSAPRRPPRRVRYRLLASMRRWWRRRR